MVVAKGRWSGGGPRRSVRPGRSSSISAGLVVLLSVLGTLGLLGLSDVSASVLVQEQIDVSATSQPGLETLAARTVSTTHPCARVRVTGVVLGTTASRGSITIVLPRACRGTTFRFFPALGFTDTNSNQGRLGLYTNAWTGNFGRLTVCLSRPVGGCTSNNLAITSATAPPAATNVPALTLGTVYGPSVTTRMTAAGTATVVLVLSLQANRAGGNTPAVYQQMEIDLTVTQV